MDYAKWVERLRSFILGLQERSPVDKRDEYSIKIAPCLRDDEVKALAKSIDCGLPPPLREFLLLGASSINFEYSRPYEDPTCETFCPAEQLADWRMECIEYSKRSWLMEPEWPLDQAFWRHALPLARYPDGDGIALWVHDCEHPNPPVVYLRHDSQSFLLSRNLDEFLHEWEQLEYTGIGAMEDCRDPNTGFLNSKCVKGVA